MSTIQVYWRQPGFATDRDEAYEEGTTVHHGVLTTEHDEAEGEAPILVEEVTGRTYSPGELPPNTVVYLETSPGPLPEIAELARAAGYRVQRA